MTLSDIGLDILQSGEHTVNLAEPWDVVVLGSEGQLLDLTGPLASLGPRRMSNTPCISSHPVLGDWRAPPSFKEGDNGLGTLPLPPFLFTVVI